MRGRQEVVMDMIRLLVLTLCVSVVQIWGNDMIKRLPDGVRVRVGPDLVIQEGIWTVLLTITEPGRDYRSNERRTLLEKVDKLWTLINGTTWDSELFDQKKESFYQRLQLIRADPSIHFELGESTPRRKRGLIDVGGWLLNKVFGVATEAQIQAVQQELARSSLLDQAIVHNVNQLITTVNQSRLEEKATRKYLRKLEVAHNELVLSEFVLP